MTTQQIKQVAALLQKRLNDSGMSQASFSDSIGINKSTVNHVINGRYRDNPQLISDKKWRELAQAIGYRYDGWQTAETFRFMAITSLLDRCKEESKCAMSWSYAGAGKTQAVNWYRLNKGSHTYYIDCSEGLGKNKLIHHLAALVGAEHGKTNMDTYHRCLTIMGKMEKPLVIFDEAGDMEDNSLRLIKNMINRLPGCGFYLVGAQGFHKKMVRGLKNNRLGYEEIYSRFGRNFVSIDPPAGEAEKVNYADVTKVCRANGLTDESAINLVFNNSSGDFRRVKVEVEKALKRSRHLKAIAS